MQALLTFEIPLKWDNLIITNKKHTMKKLFTIALLATGIMTGLNTSAQDDKSKRPSPFAKVQQELKSGALISIEYSQPSVKGRSIGKDLEPMEGKIWRTGANEATVFETNQDVTILGSTLPAGKYSMFTIINGNEVTVIFNKVWKQWGAFKYDEESDQLRIKTKLTGNSSFAEKMTIDISPDGKVMLLWGSKKFSFPII